MSGDSPRTHTPTEGLLGRIKLRLNIICACMPHGQTSSEGMRHKHGQTLNLAVSETNVNVEQKRLIMRQ